MRTRACLSVAAAAVVLLCAGPLALGQPVTFRYRVKPGQRYLYNRAIRTEIAARSGDESRETVIEVVGTREELVVETKADPSSARFIELQSLGGERLLALKVNGEDRLTTIPESDRLRPLAPVLAAQWRNLQGEPVDKPPLPVQPAMAIEAVQAEMLRLPDKPMAPGQTVSREVDVGLAKATITTRYLEQRAVGTVPAAILEVTAKVAYTGEHANRVTVEKLSAELAWAIDGSGYVSNNASVIVVEKGDKGEQRIVRALKEQRTGTSLLAPAALAKVKSDIDLLERAMASAKAGDLDAALKELVSFLRANPEHAWVPAVQNLHAGLARQRLVTKTVPSARLRLMLRDLQTARDRAGMASAAQVAEVDRTIRQIAEVNEKQILEDAVDPDPVVRDLAAFGLAFLLGAKADAQLTAMLDDASTQVRGTAVVSLAIRGKAVDPSTLVNLLTDQDDRTCGAAALLATRTVAKDDPQAAALLPIVIGNFKLKNPWSRRNMIAAVVTFASKGSPKAVRALIDGHNAEPEPRLKPAYLMGLDLLTDLKAAEIAPYEAWLKEHATDPEPQPKAPAAPKAKG